MNLSDHKHSGAEVIEYGAYGCAICLAKELAAEREANDQLSHGLKFIRAALNCDSSELDVIVPAIENLLQRAKQAERKLEVICEAFTNLDKALAKIYNDNPFLPS